MSENLKEELRDKHTKLEDNGDGTFTPLFVVGHQRFVIGTGGENRDKLDAEWYRDNFASALAAVVLVQRVTFKDKKG